MNRLFAPVSSLTGIGKKTAETLEGFTGGVVCDLLWHLPVGLIDRRYRPPLVEAEDGRIATFEVEIVQHKPPPRGRRGLPYRVLCRNDTGFLTLVFFHAKADWLTRSLPVGEMRIVSGRLERYRETLQIVHPDHMLAADEFEKLPPIEPTYPLTANLSGRVLVKALAGLMPEIPALPEWHDPAQLAAQKWPDWQSAVRRVHQPVEADDLTPLAPARARLAYDELLAHQLVLALMRRQQRRRPGRAFEGTGKLQGALHDRLPFTLTGAQSEAIAEIARDLAAETRMARLLQGDVGSGKTLVALTAILQVIESGAQAALMAPTELLAAQHAATLAPHLDALGIAYRSITGRNKGQKRAEALGALADGSAQLAIGTHGLFQEDVAFADLGLVVVDEQHRFGVRQRMRLAAKGHGVDMLVMTATPIPRTLTLTIYGDMDVSRMHEKPPGRQSVETRAIAMTRTEEIVEGLERVLGRGERIYWVCPLVAESEALDLAAVEDRFKTLRARYGDAVGLVHGQMKPAEKDKTMDAFRRGDISLLVGTTVIEVGVDVPEATVMVVEHAERFGLAQLHQLRGRVGRGAAQSSCILLYRAPLGENARARLRIMRETEDGFAIAEEDLRLRGAGEVLGTRQSGLPAFRLADLHHHASMLPTIADEVRKILEHDDPELTGERGQALRCLLYLFRLEEVIGYLQSG